MTDSEKEVKRIVGLLWKIRQTHMEATMSSYGKVCEYIDEALGVIRLGKAWKESRINKNG